MKEEFYVFILFIALALVIRAIGYLYTPGLWLIPLGLIAALMVGFITSFFLGFQLKDRLKKRGG